MTATDIITRCDRIKPNVQSYEQKRNWLNVIESDIRDYASMYSGQNTNLSFLDEENPTLLLDEKNADLYVYYLISMIDLSNQEYDLYNNSSAFFNDRMKKWQKKYRRENIPKCNVSIKV